MSIKLPYSHWKTDFISRYSVPSTESISRKAQNLFSNMTNWPYLQAIILFLEYDRTDHSHFQMYNLFLEKDVSDLTHFQAHLFLKYNKIYYTHF